MTEQLALLPGPRRPAKPGPRNVALTRPDGTTAVVPVPNLRKLEPR